MRDSKRIARGRAVHLGADGSGGFFLEPRPRGTSLLNMARVRSSPQGDSGLIKSSNMRYECGMSITAPRCKAARVVRVTFACLVSCDQNARACRWPYFSSVRTKLVSPSQLLNPDMEFV